MGITGTKSLKEFGWDELDRQHRSVVGSIDFLGSAVRHRASDLVALRRILVEVQEHFDWEESQMLLNGYPDLGRHRADHHRQFLNLKDLIKLVDAGHETLDADFFAACREWNFRHIRSMDADFVLFCEDREAWDLQRELQAWDYVEQLASHPD